MSARRIFLTTYAVFLIGLLLWPFAAPGALVHRDMVVVPHPALSLSALGFGDLPARNAPQDGLLALVGMLFDASLAARVALVAAAVVGAYGVVGLAKHLGATPWGVVAALTITLYNPFVVERLLQGQWSLVMAAWLLPAIAGWGLSGRPFTQALAMWLAALTPTGAVAALIVGVATSHRKLFTACVVVGCCTPWLIPALVSPVTSTASGVWAFAPRAQAWVGSLGAVVGLGGIWNAAAVPASRELGFALAGVGVFAVLLLGVRRCPRVLLVLAASALGLIVGVLAVPGVFEWLIEHVPGVALWRDSHKLVLLCIPAYAALAACVRRKTLAAVVVALCFLQLPDAGQAVSVLRPVPVSAEWDRLAAVAAGRDVFIPDTPALTIINGHPTVAPRSKVLSLVEPGALTVDGHLVDPPSRRYIQAQRAWDDGDLGTLEQLGVGVIMDDTHQRIVETAAPPRRGWRYDLGLGLTLAWSIIPLAIGLVGLRQRRQQPLKLGTGLCP